MLHGGVLDEIRNEDIEHKGTLIYKLNSLHECRRQIQYIYVTADGAVGGEADKGQSNRRKRLLFALNIIDCLFIVLILVWKNFMYLLIDLKSCPKLF